MTHELQHYPFYAMGCHMQIVLAGDGDQHGAVSLVRDTIAYHEAVLSRFRADSELNRLHDHPDTWQACSPVLWQVLAYADWAYHYSDGLIDPTIRSALEAHGYDRTYAEIAEPQTPTSAPVSQWPTVQRDARTQRICIPAGVRIDLAGVAKSWSAQHAITLLHDFAAAAIDAAGDIVCHGTPPNLPAWPVDIEPLPADSEAPIMALNAQRCMATSGNDKRSWQRADGSRAHHIIDPRSGAPAHSDVMRASVIAPTLVQADVMARLLVILGVEAGLAWLTQHPDCAAALDTTTGSRVLSPSWHTYQWEELA